MQHRALIFQSVSFIHNKNTPREAMKENPSFQCNSYTHLTTTSYNKTVTVVRKTNSKSIYQKCTQITYQRGYHVHKTTFGEGHKSKEMFFPRRERHNAKRKEPETEGEDNIYNFLLCARY